MDITHRASFYEVVQRGSFSAAADALGVSKGMLSRHVSALESALNAQLLQRTTRRLSLTEAGRTLYVQAGQIAALARQAEQDIQALTEEDSGRLRFTCPVSTGDRMVSELLTRFAEICPGVEVELNFTNAMIDMSQGENDIALRAMDQVPDNLVALPLGQLKDVVVASPTLLAREGSPPPPMSWEGAPACSRGTTRPGSSGIFARQGRRPTSWCRGRCGPITTALCCNWLARAWGLPSARCCWWRRVWPGASWWRC